MTIAKWQAGKTYSPGAFVQPFTNPAPIVGKLTNPGFESGGTGWDLDAGLTVVSTDHYAGTQSLSMPGSGDNVFTQKAALNQDKIVGRPGQAISAKCQVQQGASIAGAAGGWVFIRYFNADDLQVGDDVEGNHVTDGAGGAWHPSNVADNFPATAVYARIGGVMFNASDSHTVWIDAFSIVSTYTPPPNGLTFEAVQDAPAKSGNAEPDWPTATGATVIDGGVTWQAVVASQVVWQASPLMESGDTEPAWPTVSGAAVRDGTIDWTAKPFQITDPHCPQSTIVAIAGAKVFAADGDVIRFSATINAADWTAVDDAGFLPYGLNTYGSNPVAGMGLYRSNLVVFNAEGMQMWQVDPDPANMAHLDSLPISSTQSKVLAPIANDLLFLSPEGVRSLGIAGGSTNLKAGDVGTPIDPLVRAALKAAMDAGGKVLATYVPARGQYWLAFPGYPAPQTLSDNEFNGTTQFPSVYDIPIPADASYLKLKFTTGSVPDKFQVVIGGVTVLDTGYFGNAADPTVVANFDAFLAAKGLPTETMHQFAGEATDDAESQWAAGDFDDAIIYKGGSETTATVNVYSGGDASIFHFGLEVPEETTVFVYTQNGKVAGWSRYVFPFVVDDFCQFGDDLYLRAGDDLLKVDDSVVTDYAVTTVGPNELPFDGVIQWPWLNFGSPATKQLQGVEVIGDGLPTIEVGYDETDQSAFTPAYDIPVADTLPGQMIPLPVMAPSLSVRITYKGILQTAPFRLQAVALYLNGQRMTA